MKLMVYSLGLLFVTIDLSHGTDSATQSLLKDPERRELLIKLVRRGLKPNFKMTLEELREMEKNSSKEQVDEEENEEIEDVHEL
jgi:hypothetical protein